MAEACTYAEERINQTAYVSLGGFGGYIIVGFDHSIVNDGDYNIAITGNAFDGSSEPGIVWVMQDENGDGLPNDTWYELRGSEYGKAEAWQGVASALIAYILRPVGKAFGLAIGSPPGATLSNASEQELLSDISFLPLWRK